MKTSKRYVILCVIIATVLMVQAAAMVNSVVPDYSYTCTGRVIIAGSSPTQGVSGAQVKIYNNDFGVYLGLTYTDAQGYFQKTVGYQFPIEEMSARVYKAGYPVEWDYARPSGANVYFGNIALDPPPPTAPTITNINVKTGGPRYVRFTFNVAWDPTATSREVSLYWSHDSTVDAQDWVKTEYPSSTGTSFSWAIPKEEVFYSEHTFWYRIVASNTHAGGTTDADTDIDGIPRSLVAGISWKIEAYQDTYTDFQDPNTSYGSSQDLELKWLTNIVFMQYHVPEPEAVESIVLNAYVKSIGSSGFGEIVAHNFDNELVWDEYLLTWANQPELGIPVYSCTEGAADQWSLWDITFLTATMDPVIKGTAYGAQLHIALVEVEGPGASAVFSSSEGPIDLEPYLEVKYLGEPESPQPGTGFVDDDFNGPELAEPWTHTILGSPDDMTFEPDGWPMEPDYRDMTILYHFTPTRDDLMIGHILDQGGLSIPGAFVIEMDCGGGQLVGTDDYKVGLALYDQNDILICNLYIQLGNYFRNDGFAGSIVGETLGSYASNSIQLSSGKTLIIERDMENNLRLWWKHLEEPSVLLLEEFLGSYFQTVTKVKLLMLSHSPPDSTGHSAWVYINNIKLHTSIDVDRPSIGISQFSNPVLESEFANIPGDSIDYWKSLDESNPVGSLVTITEEDGVDRDCWQIQETDDAGGQWFLMQELTELDPDFSKFQYASLYGHKISFSFFAKEGSTPSRARAVIRYLTSDSESWTCVAGPWVGLSGTWTMVPVNTRYPIPDSVTTIQVVMEGQSSILGSLDFTGFVDSACVSIVESLTVEDWNLMSSFPDHEGTVGDISVTLGLLKAWQNTDRSWEFDATAVITCNTLTGFDIKSVTTEFSITQGQEDPSGAASISSYNGELGASQSNNWEYSTTTYTQAEADIFVNKQRFGIRWESRLLTYFFTYGVGSIPIIGWLANDLFTSSAEQRVLAPYLAHVIDDTTTDGDGGYLFEDYEPSPDPITEVVIALPLHWTVDDCCTQYLTISFEIDLGYYIVSRSVSILLTTYN
ncbi:MAG: hypothetical protein ACFFER_16550 [Candidatus Thorarchaeota archaeon]